MQGTALLGCTHPILILIPVKDLLPSRRTKRATLQQCPRDIVVLFVCAAPIRKRLVAVFLFSPFLGGSSLEVFCIPADAADNEDFAADLLEIRNANRCSSRSLYPCLTDAVFLAGNTIAPIVVLAIFAAPGSRKLFMRSLIPPLPVQRLLL